MTDPPDPVEVMLHPGIDEPWAPPITLEHDAKRNEMYVIRGEEAAAMVEHVSARQFREIRDALRGGRSDG